MPLPKTKPLGRAGREVGLSLGGIGAGSLVPVRGFAMNCLILAIGTRRVIEVRPGWPSPSDARPKIAILSIFRGRTGIMYIIMAIFALPHSRRPDGSKLHGASGN